MKKVEVHYNEKLGMWGVVCRRSSKTTASAWFETKAEAEEVLKYMKKNWVAK